jgi:hypothetical protein
MASLSEVSNGIIVLKNDIASDICRRLLNIAKPSFDEMNLVLASHVASILLPCTTQKNGQEKDTLNDVFYRLCPHPVCCLINYSPTASYEISFLSNRLFRAINYWISKRFHRFLKGPRSLVHTCGLVS